MYNLTIISFVAIVLLGSVCVHAQKDMHESVLDRFAKNYWSKIYENQIERLNSTWFTTAVRKTGLNKLLYDPASGPFTVLIPDDDAFMAVLPVLRKTSSLPEYESVENIPIEILDQVIRYHVIPRNYPFQAGDLHLVDGELVAPTLLETDEGRIYTIKSVDVDGEDAIFDGIGSSTGSESALTLPGASNLFHDPTTGFTAIKVDNVLLPDQVDTLYGRLCTPLAKHMGKCR